MSASEPPSFDPIRWLNHQPYLLLSLTALFWAGNIVLGRYVAGHVPPMTLSCVRWIGSCLMLLPFAWPHLIKDWPVLRRHLPLMFALATTGFALNNALSYWGLQFTQALNALLIQSSGPLFIALWALVLFGVKLLGLLQQLLNLRFQPRHVLVHVAVTHRLVPRGVRSHLRPVGGQVSKLDHTHLASQAQHLEEQGPKRRQVDLAEIADRAEVRRIVTDNGSKGQIALAGGRHPSAGADSHGVGVDQERDHHGHVERRLAAQLLA